MAKLIASGVVALIALITILSCGYTIDQGERGVILHNGAAAGESEPGFHLKLPYITSIKHISLRLQKTEYNGDGKGLVAYSKDQQPANIRLSANWHVTSPTNLYIQYGSMENAESTVINPRVYEQLKNVFGQFDAVEAIQDRARLNAEVTTAIQGVVKGPIQIDSIQIENIEFSGKYEQAVEDRMEAQVRQQQAIAQKQQRITNADAAAYEVKAAADAKAHQIEVQGKAEASAIQARGQALRENPELPSLVAAEKWDGQLPTTMVPGNSVPFVNLSKTESK